MRILLVHNYYGFASPSGENKVFDLEKELLVSRGHDVRVYARQSDEIRNDGLVGMLRGAMATPWSLRARREVNNLASEFKPDVVHVHNTFPLISPSIFSALPENSGRVLTLHNYRIFCPAAIPLRNGKVCTECIDKRSSVPSLVHGCYRGSRVATLPLALSVSLHRHLGTWQRDIDAFVALTRFQVETMVRAGLSRELVELKPHFFPGAVKMVDWTSRPDAVTFVGRLSEEKGVRELVSAWVEWGAGAPRLDVVGDGPLRHELEAISAGARNINFIGQVPSEKAHAYIKNARLLILPSICFEGFPMVIREAFAFGTPSLVSDIGPLPGLVSDVGAGASFKAGDWQNLLLSAREILEKPNVLAGMARQARKEFEEKYSEDANYHRIMEIYSSAISRRQKGITRVSG